MSILVNGVTAVELPGSPRESYDRDGVQLERDFKVPWDQRSDFVGGMLGGSLEGAFGLAMVYAPEPFEPGSPYVAVRAAVHGHANATRGVDVNGYLTYVEAAVTITYDFPDDDDEVDDETDPDDVWREESAAYESRYMVVPKYGLKEAVSGANIDNVTVVPITQGTFIYRWPNVGIIRRALFTRDIGSMNDAVWKGHPINKLIYAGFNPRKTINVRGATIQRSMTMSVKYRSVEWDHVWSAVSGKFIKAVNQDGDSYPPECSFTSIGRET